MCVVNYHMEGSICAVGAPDKVKPSAKPNGTHGSGSSSSQMTGIAVGVAVGVCVLVGIAAGLAYKNGKLGRRNSKDSTLNPIY